MQIEKISVEKLKYAKYKIRVALKAGDADFEKLKNSIENFGYQGDVVDDNFLLTFQ